MAVDWSRWVDEIAELWLNNKHDPSLTLDNFQRMVERRALYTVLRKGNKQVGISVPVTDMINQAGNPTLVIKKLEWALAELNGIEIPIEKQPEKLGRFISLED